MSNEDAITSENDSTHAYHALPLEEVFETLRADPENGLPDDEVRLRIQKFGQNAIPKIRGPFWQVYIAPIMNWLITIYILSSIGLIIIAQLLPPGENEMGQALVWLGIVAINALVAIFQQYRAQKKLEALEKLSAGEARVIRQGSEKSVPPFEIVPGDIIKLDQGDRIPADARLITSSNLTTNEASLTGESVPVVKDEQAIVARDVPLTDMRNMVFFGTYIATGMATVVTTATGGHTEIGKIQGTLEALNTGDIPLRRKVNLLAKYLGIAALILMSVSVLWQVFVFDWLNGQPINLGYEHVLGQTQEAITRAMTIMPINIPLLTTIVLLTGVLAMAKKGVIIRDLSAVESLGRVSVICSDKTGTMTRNQMTVKYCWDTHNLYTVKGDGYDPIGGIYLLEGADDIITLEVKEQEVRDVFKWKGLFRLVVCGGINNDSEIVREIIPDQGEIWKPLGDPTDAALLTLFRKSGLDEEAISKKYEIIQEFPFESELKRMTKICKDGKKFVAFTKGATEVLLPKCTMVDGKDSPTKITSDIVNKVRTFTTDFASKGYRVISLAYRQLDKVPTGNDARDEAENNLIYLGFACIVDPPRDGVKEAVSACHSAGINVIMITGDAAATAKTIAEDLGIFKVNSLVVEGSDIADVSDDDFARTNVFARVDPDHKQIIVERYQDQQRVVAMTGDGVNDALALAMSDAGIAMGITGTDVAKEAADLVITDDSFASIVSGVHQGRGLFNKIRMMIYFYVAINLFESIIFFGALFFLPDLSFLETWQSIYLVVTTHSFPGLALVFDRTSPHAMEDKPRDSQALITRNLGKFMALNVILMTIGAASVFMLTLTGWGSIVDVYVENNLGFYGTIDAPYKANVMLLSVILLVESTIVLSIRRINMPLHKSIREPGTWVFVVLLGLIYIAHFLLMYVPLAQEILSVYSLHFYFAPLTSYDWLIVVLGALPAIIGLELYKWRFRNHDVDL